MSDADSDALAAEFIAVSRRTLQEQLQRIEACVDVLTTDQLWERRHETENAVGNLILHLRGKRPAVDRLRRWGPARRPGSRRGVLGPGPLGRQSAPRAAPGHLGGGRCGPPGPVGPGSDGIQADSGASADDPARDLSCRRAFLGPRRADHLGDEAGDRARPRILSVPRSTQRGFLSSDVVHPEFQNCNQRTFLRHLVTRDCLESGDSSRRQWPYNTVW